MGSNPLFAAGASYDEIIQEERNKIRGDDAVEDFASGMAALTVGVYGYHNDKRGNSGKVAYIATQTAGIFIISNSLQRLNRPSLLLSTDRYLKKNGSLSSETYKRLVVRSHEQEIRASRTQWGYLGLILAATYGYSAYRERENETLRNVFAFISFNCLVVSAVNFGQMAFSAYDVDLSPEIDISTGKMRPAMLLSWKF